MDDNKPSIRFKDIFAAAPTAGHRLPQGDKILLPPSALQTLLDATAQAQQQARQQEGLHSQYSYSYASSHRQHGGFSDWTNSNGGAAQDKDGAALPQPLTFRLVNTANQRVVFAGIREFSADEGQVVLSSYLRAALGIDTDTDIDGSKATGDEAGPRIAVYFEPLPKGTFVHLRPLEAGYNPSDWRALLERQLREGFTTLTKGALLTVRGSSAGETFRLRIDGFQPEGDGICVVDTDLEVDIEALDEEQALETVRQIQAKGSASGGSDEAAGGSSVGGKLDIFKPVQGRVLAGDYVDYELPSWDRSRPLEISLSGLQGGGDSGDGGDDEEQEPGYAVDLLVSPRSARQRALPRETEHVWANLGLADGTAGSKTIRIPPTSTELEDAEALLVTVHGWRQPSGSGAASSSSAAHPYTLRARVVLEEEAAASVVQTLTAGQESHSSDEEQCQNCRQWVPKRTMVLHENFCRRNNAICPQCQQVFQARSAAWQNHWHCTIDPVDDGQGNTAASRAKHEALFHTAHACPAETCDVQLSFSSLPALAHHRTTTCPAKLILCQFCHLEVPQEGDPSDPAVEAATALTGMTPHERADGARTTECYLCDAIVRMRDMRAHLQHHALDRQRRPPPPICRNAMCGRTRFGVGSRGQVKGAPAGSSSNSNTGSNPLGLCGTCFAPLYVSTHDPEGRALRRRIERRYLSQLLTGCGRAWCANAWCKTGRQNQKMGAFEGGRGGSGSASAATGGTAALLPLVKPLVAEASGGNDAARPMHFCVDETNQQRQAVAEMLAGQGRYELAWCMAACEAEGPDATRAWSWLSSWAPDKGTDV